MKIAVNTRLLLKNKLDGIGWFTYETLKRITTNHPEHEFIFFFDRKYDEEFIFSNNIKPVVIPPQSRHPFLWLTWFEASLGYALRKHKADVFLSPDGYLCLNTNMPSLAVIHDINFHHRPQDLPYFTRNYFNIMFPKYAKKAKRIATVSEYSKKDICESYTIDSNKVDVVYNGVNEQYRPLTEVEIKSVKDQYTNGMPYFIFIGTLLPRKNISRMLLAFELFRKESSQEFKFLIVGDKKFGFDDISHVLDSMKFKEDVQFLGRVEPKTLHFLLGGAFALLYAPVFEGFGIPIIEAFSCKVPVICSNITSMPEVAGDAAILIDPFSIRSIEDAMLKLTSDDKLRETLVFNSIQQLEKFSWNNTSERLWKSLENIFFI